MDKNILNDYIDACALVKETERDIRALKKKRKTIIQTNVSGSNPDFPYQPQHFKIEGTVFTCADDSALRRDEGLLERRKAECKREQSGFPVPAAAFQNRRHSLYLCGRQRASAG